MAIKVIAQLREVKIGKNPGTTDSAVIGIRCGCLLLDVFPSERTVTDLFCQ